MGKKCNSCGCDGGSGAQLSAQLGQALNDISVLQDAMAFLTGGHPILEIEDPADIAQFDMVTGIGGGAWNGWGVCNGNTYKGIVTRDMRDNFLVGAGGTYNVGDTGGVNSVVLATSQIPSHTHGITDPGHTHVVTDLGHTHPITDPGHTHVGASSPHFHTYTTPPGQGTHVHQSIGSQLFDTGGGGSQSGPDLNAHNAAFPDHQAAGSAHQHSGNTDNATSSVTITAAFTGITTAASAFTGISNAVASTGVVVNAIGGGLSHENRPPFLALIFVKKIF